MKRNITKGIKRQNHPFKMQFLFRSLMSSTDYSFEVITSRECGLEANRPDKAKLLIVQCFYNLSGKLRNIVFTSQSPRKELNRTRFLRHTIQNEKNR